MHMKEGKGSPSSHLKNAITYILNDEKTRGGDLVGGNSGVNGKEIFEAFLETKQFYQKEGKRQGYHFVISFEQFEATESQAYEVIENFCKKYFGDNYEYVFAIHNDKAHMHGHIIFNSVSRNTGNKFHSPNGDWGKNIQPLVDQCCMEQGLSPLAFDSTRKKGKHYAEYLAEKNSQISWKKIMVKDIDFAIAQSDSYFDFLVYMKKLGYEIRQGNSEVHGRYFTMKLVGGKKARRNYSLGVGYAMNDIKYKIEHKINERAYNNQWKRIKPTKLYSGYKKVNPYQLHRIRVLYQTARYQKRSIVKPLHASPYEIRKQLFSIEKMRESCRYLVRNNIRSEEELVARETHIKNQDVFLKADRKRAYQLKDSKEEIREITEEIRAIRNELKMIHYCRQPLENLNYRGVDVKKFTHITGRRI